jgi:hypothetical protein
LKLTLFNGLENAIAANIMDSAFINSSIFGYFSNRLQKIEQIRLGIQINQSIFVPPLFIFEIQKIEEANIRFYNTNLQSFLC